MTFRYVSAPLTAGSLTLSVVVVTWNSASVIDGLLRSLLETLPQGSWELVVVDNASTDATVSLVQARLPSALIIRNPTNRGLAAANNQGLVAAKCDSILICNPDVIFRPEAVGAMVDVLVRHPRAGWVVPRLTCENGEPQTSAGDLPTFTAAILGRQASRRWQRGTTNGFWWDGWAHDQERTIGRGHEAAYVVKRRAIAEVGLQDEQYVLDWEGIDWTDRFRRSDWEVWLAPTARVVHLGGASIRQVPFRSIVSQHRGMYRYFASRRSVGVRPFIAAAIASRAVVKLGLVAAGLPMYQLGQGLRVKRGPVVGSDEG